MKRLIAGTLTVGLAAASCSGNGGSSYSPAASSRFPSTRSHARAALTAPAGWATTNTQAITLTNATDNGAAAPAQSITVRLGLQMQNAPQLVSLVRSGQTITPAQFNATYAPSAATVNAVTSYLQSHGFTSVSVEPNNLIVSATGTVAQASAAFNTTLHSFTQNGKSVLANTTAAYVPSALQGDVVAVLGLNTAQMFAATPKKGGAGAAPAPSPTPTVAPATPCQISSAELVALPSPQPEPSGVTSAAGCLRTYAPADYWRAYDALNLAAAQSINIAVMAEGNVTQAVSDFRTNESGDGLVQVPVTIKQVGLASTDTSGDDEWTLDMTASSGMARAVKNLYLYDVTSLDDADIALEYNHWVTDNLAPIGNSSFGGCEFGPYLDGSMVLDDEILLQGAAQGQTMFASSGDTGSFCSVGTPNGVPAGAPFVEYPASSPYVVAVGGTTLITQSDGSYQGEAAWYSGGGGVSQFEAPAPWETTQPGSSEFRGVPDIAMDADLQTGMNLYLSDAGGWTVIGGTSLASPLAAGSWARMLQAKGKSLGFAAEQLYASYAASTAGSPTTVVPSTIPVGGFHDIITGANGAYTALPGYDYTTGLGSLDLGLLNGTLP